MAGQPSIAGANIMLDALNGRATQTLRTTYLALLTAAPNDASTMASMTELTVPATNGYARQAVTWGAPAADPSLASNTGLLTFGAFTADLGNVTHLALVTAVTGTAGVFLWYWTADVAKDPANGDSITVAIGALTMSAD
jgi:hypothetical protein